MAGRARDVNGIRLMEYTLQAEIGRGSFGVVYKAYVKEKTGERQYAIKRISLEDPKQAKRELKIAEKLPEHPNLVTSVDLFFHRTKPRAYIVMEYCKAGNLNDYIIAENPSLEELLPLMLEVAKGLCHLHKYNVMHRDLKPENILLSRHDGRIVCKIGDFGLSRMMRESSFADTVCGTSWYMAPEVLDRAKYTFAVDIFSLGLVYYVMVTQESVTDGEDELLAPIMEHKGKKKPLAVFIRTTGLSKRSFVEAFFSELPSLGEFVYQMLEYEPTDRPDAQEVVAQIAEIKGSVLGGHTIRQKRLRGRDAPRARDVGLARAARLSSTEDDDSDQLGLLSFADIHL